MQRVRFLQQVVATTQALAEMEANFVKYASRVQNLSAEDREMIFNAFARQRAETKLERDRLLLASKNFPRKESALEEVQLYVVLVDKSGAVCIKTLSPNLEYNLEELILQANAPCF